MAVLAVMGSLSISLMPRRPRPPAEARVKGWARDYLSIASMGLAEAFDMTLLKGVTCSSTYVYIHIQSFKQKLLTIIMDFGGGKPKKLPIGPP